MESNRSADRDTMTTTTPPFPLCGVSRLRPLFVPDNWPHDNLITYTLVSPVHYRSVPIVLSDSTSTAAWIQQGYNGLITRHVTIKELTGIFAVCRFTAMQFQLSNQTAAWISLDWELYPVFNTDVTQSRKDAAENYCKEKQSIQHLRIEGARETWTSLVASRWNTLDQMSV